MEWNLYLILFYTWRIKDEKILSLSLGSFISPGDYAKNFVCVISLCNLYISALVDLSFLTGDDRCTIMWVKKISRDKTLTHENLIIILVYMNNVSMIEIFYRVIKVIGFLLLNLFQYYDISV